MTQPGQGSSNRVATDVATMETAARQIEDSHGELEQLLGALRTTVSSSPDVWQGRSGMAFTDVMSRWDRSALQLNEALAAIVAGIRTNGRAYEGTVETQAQSLNVLGDSLHGTY
ncbi:WXG100 family type VII secretion target [Rhodococcus ruber]|uniref:Uncharacterized protein n=1 Tax=Rhodococcus ruber TaxID=1830 RepID=A0A098BNB4_9NOCA|nr:WXG100 family type VII secretion target [Rhodococcus ruber]AXY53224.1 hypothetical protein YT1_3829 [Rhodococcus ruber]MBP2212539.1 WXG100 family type VII secretion target [Rhodococcus ruber]MCD2128236.1 WXG100 family type VII secretion target [Rhodococcus ruber]MCZ4505217.1 WXG100 family type VII secretion target [Rhodococcus ruber]MCZ4531921.1 WXG100 family type VII secretion target [Rhodococcus ruber]